MQVLKLIALLLEYPDSELWQEAEALRALSAEIAPELLPYTESYLSGCLLDTQAKWCETFDRGRATSLLLFEHVHAESRDRGQAMVDLMAQYEQAGLQLSCRELPDYLPLYLEYLSIQPAAEARQELNDIAPILALLGARLQERNSAFSQLFDRLLIIANSKLCSSSVAGQIASETRDDTLQALDAVWEEEQVKFIDDQACGSAAHKQYQQRFRHQVTPQYLDLSAGGSQ